MGEKSAFLQGPGQNIIVFVWSQYDGVNIEH